ncbi:S8 family peptidase [Novosphingobium lentum]|uniref:S8 family peptidase n=1 Tax=Novosphingobium lentum TaxID=145287 RepID=UPI000830A0E2|nr:S8 family peptidase [Novosphingobium lentum]
MYHNAIAGWSQGYTGKGVTIAIVDGGIDMTNPEFAGRISSASADVAANRGIQQQDDHGTQVALTAAAARDNTGILGIAFDATIQVLRADTPGTCTTPGANGESGCTFGDTAIAAGVDKAVAAGARVINLSLGGSNANGTLAAAIARASAAGVVVVVAAGNDGKSTDPAKDPNNPDPFPTSIQMAGGTNVIIAGSVDNTGTISDFSNRAGTEATWYLSALGQQLCCVYENGVLKVTTNASGQRFVTVVSGTSFAAPQISGAVALLAQAFPNLTGAQIVDLLLRTARDAGAVGTDPIYGRGILDIQRAFAPQGTTSLAGTLVPLPLGDTTGVTSSAMGDAVTGASLGAVIIDGYSRAYAVDLARSLRAAQVEPRLTNALATGTRTMAVGNRTMSLAFSVDGRGRHTWIAPLRLGQDDADRARVLAASITSDLAPGRRIGFAYHQGADGLVAQMEGHHEPAFLIASGPTSDLGFVRSSGSAFAYRHQLGRWGLTVSAEDGAALTGPVAFADSLARPRERERIARMGLAADRRFGAVDTVLGLSWLREDRTVLGARFHDAFGGGGASTLFADANVGWDLAPDWRLGAAARFGWTRADRTGTVAGGSQLLSSSWALDVEKVGVLGTADRLAFRLSQPLRVESGGLNLQLPTGYDYATLATTYGLRPLSLAPHGREMVGELAWRTALWRGALGTSLFYRRQPGHFAALPDDKGVALRWERAF